jgi:hypothetical protein
MRKTVTLYIPDGYANAREFLRDCQFEQAPIATVEMLDALLSHINFDGVDSSGITIGELRRALPTLNGVVGTPAP